MTTREFIALLLGVTLLLGVHCPNRVTAPISQTDPTGEPRQTEVTGDLNLPPDWPAGWWWLGPCTDEEILSLIQMDRAAGLIASSGPLPDVLALTVRTRQRPPWQDDVGLTEEFIEEVVRRGAGSRGLLTLLETLGLAGAAAVLSGALIPGPGGGLGAVSPLYRYRCLLRWQELRALDYRTPMPPTAKELAEAAVNEAMSIQVLLEHADLQRKFFPDAFSNGKFTTEYGCTVDSRPISNFAPRPGPPYIPDWLQFQVGVTGQHSEYMITAPDGDEVLFDGVRLVLTPEPLILLGIEVKGDIDPGEAPPLARWARQADD